ncbi:hypothetical protein ACHQM5_004725 [Ranunculus cassubicifolius]
MDEEFGNDDDDQSVADPENSPRGAGSSEPTDQVVSDQGGNVVAPVIEVVAPVAEVEESTVEKNNTTRTINLSERALQRSEERRKGIAESSSTTTTTTTTSAPTAQEGARATSLRRDATRVARGVRGTVRGRGTIPRGGRRQA